MKTIPTAISDAEAEAITRMDTINTTMVRISTIEIADRMTLVTAGIIMHAAAAEITRKDITNTQGIRQTEVTSTAPHPVGEVMIHPAVMATIPTIAAQEAPALPLTATGIPQAREILQAAKKLLLPREKTTAAQQKLKKVLQKRDQQACRTKIL
jgi:hypothetical protein